MTTIERPNRRILDRAIEIFRDAMREFIVRHLRRIPGRTLEQAVETAFVQRRRDGRGNEFKNHLDGGGTVQGFIDTADFDLLISYYWNDVFRDFFKGNREIQTECHIIANARNEIAHPGESDRGTEETRATLVFAVKALGRLNHIDGQREVQRLLDGIVDPKVGELAEEVGQLTLKMNEQSTTLEGLENDLEQAVSSLEGTQETLEALAGRLDAILEGLSAQQASTDIEVESIKAQVENLSFALSQVRSTQEEVNQGGEAEQTDETEQWDEVEQADEVEQRNEAERVDDIESPQELNLRMQVRQQLRFPFQVPDMRRIVSQVREQLSFPFVSPSPTSLRMHELGIMPNARYYCTVSECRFTDGARRSWYNRHKAQHHARITGHEVKAVVTEEPLDS